MNISYTLRSEHDKLIKGLNDSLAKVSRMSECESVLKHVYDHDLSKIDREFIRLIQTNVPDVQIIHDTISVYLADIIKYPDGFDLSKECNIIDPATAIADRAALYLNYYCDDCPLFINMDSRIHNRLNSHIRLGAAVRAAITRGISSFDVKGGFPPGIYQIKLIKFDISSYQCNWIRTGNDDVDFQMDSIPHFRKTADNIILQDHWKLFSHVECDYSVVAIEAVKEGKSSSKSVSSKQKSSKAN